MNVAFLAESPADTAALHILVAKIMAREMSPVDLPVRPAGWTGVLKILPTVVKHCHYHGKMDALVVLLDSDQSALHTPQHLSQEATEDCRFCMIHKTINETLRHVRPRQERIPLQYAVGMASPCIEAWLLSARRTSISEAAWARSTHANRPYTSAALKQDAYGTDRPSLLLETRRMQALITEASQNIDQLIQKFPIGLGALVQSVRGWNG